jgi:hypothetical protein
MELHLLNAAQLMAKFQATFLTMMLAALAQKLHLMLVLT